MSSLRILPRQTAQFVLDAWTSCKSSTDHHSLTMSSLSGSHALYLTNNFFEKIDSISRKLLWKGSSYLKNFTWRGSCF